MRENHVREQTLDDAMRVAIEALIAHGDAINPTKGSAKEITAFLLESAEPRSRISRTETRGKPFSCLGELCGARIPAEDTTVAPAAGTGALESRIRAVRHSPPRHSACALVLPRAWNPVDVGRRAPVPPADVCGARGRRVRGRSRSGPGVATIHHKDNDLRRPSTSPDGSPLGE